MLDSLLLLQSLHDSIKILKDARLAVAPGSCVVWDKLYNAHKYLDREVASLLAE